MDLELVFGIFSSGLSEIFCETISLFGTNQGHLVTDFKTELMRERGQLYPEYVSEMGAPIAQMWRIYGLWQDQNECTTLLLLREKMDAMI